MELHLSLGLTASFLLRYTSPGDPDTVFSLLLVSPLSPHTGVSATILSLGLAPFATDILSTLGFFGIGVVAPGEIFLFGV